MEIILLQKFRKNILIISLKHLGKINVKVVENIENCHLFVDVKQLPIVQNNVNKKIKDFILEIVNLLNSNN
jgi:hypothetical protein